jgi:hypothetical protein
MKRLNKESDFDFYLDLTSVNGISLTDVPKYLEAVFTTDGYRRYIAKVEDGECTNCLIEDGRLHIIMNNHHLNSGRLKCTVTIEAEDDSYPDGKKRLVSPLSLELELVSGQGDEPTAAELEAVLPLIKGEPFTWEDFTPEQIAELQRPANDMIAQLEATDTAVKKAEEERVTEFATIREDARKATSDANAATEKADAATASVTQAVLDISKEKQAALEAAATAMNAANAADTSREQADTAELERKANEISRQQAESERASQEEQRKKAETERELGEQARADAESQRSSSEASRQEAEDVRASQESERVEAEKLRRQAETSRQEAEQSRSTAERTRDDNEAQRIANEQARQEAEGERVKAEAERATSEQDRERAEEERINEFNASKQACDIATDAANTAATTANTAGERAESAATHQPIILQNANWGVWDIETQQYVDSGSTALGSLVYPTFDVEDGDLMIESDTEIPDGMYEVDDNGDLIVTI